MFKRITGLYLAVLIMFSMVSLSFVANVSAVTTGTFSLEYGWTGSVDGWSSDATAQIVEEGYESINALKLTYRSDHEDTETGDGDGGHAGAYKTITGLTANTTYRLEVDVKAENAVWFAAYIGTSSNRGYQAIWLAGGSGLKDWTHFNSNEPGNNGEPGKGDYTTGADQNELTIWFVVDRTPGKHAAATTWVDNVSLKEVVDGNTPGENLVENGDFEPDALSDVTGVKVYSRDGAVGLVWDSATVDIFQKSGDGEYGDAVLSNSNGIGTYIGGLTNGTEYTFKICKKAAGQTAPGVEINCTPAQLAQPFTGWTVEYSSENFGETSNFIVDGVDHGRRVIDVEYNFINDGADGSANSARFDFKNYQTDAYVDLKQTVTVKPNTSYTYVVKTKNDGINGMIAECSYNESGASWKHMGNYNDDTGFSSTVWIDTNTMTFTIDGRTEMTFSIKLNGKWWRGDSNHMDTAWAQIDSVTLYETSDSNKTNILVNGGFETALSYISEVSFLTAGGETAVIGDLAAGAITAKCSAANNYAGNTFKPVFIAALYDGNVLVDVKTDGNSLITNSQTKDFSLSVSLPDEVEYSAGRYTVKAFLWNGLSYMRPLKYGVLN